MAVEGWKADGLSVPRVQLERTTSWRGRLVDVLVGLLLGAVTVYALTTTADMGFTRDEGFYFHAAKDYLGWFEELERNVDKGESELSFTQENIDKYWSYNPEHPVLMKTLFGLSYRSLSQTRSWMDPSTAMRFPAFVFIGLLVMMLYLFVAEAFGRRAAVAASAALMLMPHVWIHAHFACFDGAMVTMWFAVCWAYWKSLKSWPWAIVTGIFFGFALITKLNGFFIPFALLAHWALNGWADFGLSRSRERGWQLHLPRVPLAFFAMATLGPLIFYLLWPRHWYESAARVAWYFERHLGHEHYPVDFFGAQHLRPPFPVEYPFVMSWYTIPLVILVAFGVGMVALALHAGWRDRAAFVQLRLKALLGGEPLATLVAGARALFAGDERKQRFAATREQLRAWRPTAAPPRRPLPHDDRGTLLLMAIAGLMPFVVIALPSTPIFGGTKHWMTAMPFIAAVAGVGIVWALDALLAVVAQILRPLRRVGLRLALSVALLPFVLWPAAREVVHSHPYGTSYFNELMGGTIGAADAGMQRQFWGYIARPALPFINEHAEPNAPVHFHDTLFYAYEMYLEDGLLRDDIRWAWSLESAQYVIYHHERAFHPFLFEVWDAFDTMSPVFVVDLDGVPLVSVYENPNYKKAKPVAKLDGY